jgi:ribosomal protein S18 acetylase RimI-like enzyme
MRTKPESTTPRCAVESINVDGDEGDTFIIQLPVTIRRCRRSDLPAMDWFGLKVQDHAIIRSTFDSQARGESVMLVAEANGEVAAQVWVDLTRLTLDATGVIWALRVLPCLQHRGIGARLIRCAEDVLREHHFTRAELSVERTNLAALRLYQQLGYERVPTVPGFGETVTTDPVPICVPATQYLLRRPLTPV